VSKKKTSSFHAVQRISEPSGERKFEIRQATPKDAIYYIEHLMRHFKESGESEPIFHPIIDFATWSEGSFYERFASRWQKPMSELGWERVWILYDAHDGAQNVVGHLDLRSAQLPSAAHRCELGIGIERIARGQGYGRKLMQTAITWAKEQGSLAWIDLAVFSQNKAAFELYRKLGFEEVGTFKDYFRVGEKSVDDVQMTLDLRSSS